MLASDGHHPRGRGGGGRGQRAVSGVGYGVGVQAGAGDRSGAGQQSEVGQESRTSADGAGAGAPVAGAAWSDRELLAHMRGGEERAFEVLVETFTPRLFATAMRMVRNEQDAADAVQLGFLKAFKALGSFQEKSTLSTWLHRIVMNECLMMLRKRRSSHEAPIDAMLPTFADDGHQTRPTRAWATGVEDVASSAETKLAVRRAIDGLPETYRTVMMMVDIEQISIDDAARMLEVTPNAVRVRLHRARQALRELLAPAMEKGNLL